MFLSIFLSGRVKYFFHHLFMEDAKRNPGKKFDFFYLGILLIFFFFCESWKIEMNLYPISFYKKISRETVYGPPSKRPPPLLLAFANKRGGAIQRRGAVTRFPGDHMRLCVKAAILGFITMVLCEVSGITIENRFLVTRHCN